MKQGSFLWIKKHHPKNGEKICQLQTAICFALQNQIALPPNDPTDHRSHSHDKNWISLGAKDDDES